MAYYPLANDEWLEVDVSPRQPKEPSNVYTTINIDHVPDTELDPAIEQTEAFASTPGLGENERLSIKALKDKLKGRKPPESQNIR
ncbi:MAG TPA: hypothetical protein VFQ70_03940 [Candidatus Saccharimonadaceae bacterium]|nr:hypothetical protein [Candidatus Saccharimonadaceae bacterium]